ncbi:hypothetical protein BDR07DRAFT_1452278 [Suillus spraguei]|nr:hypothetical protein BDR07DRAFT_1452278 [Suillus spraguei]
MAHLPSDVYLTTSFMHSGDVSPTTPKLQLQLSIPHHDPTYYIPDGNTVLLVENTLFRVHRSTLTKDKSTFDSMFSLDSDLRSSSSTSVTAGPEGESDDNPIRLQGDTAQEFRALLWALYALPHELTLALTPKANTSQLFNLARITHKYEFRSIEAWALGALTTIYTRPVHSSSAQVEDVEGPSLVQLTELASLCEQRELLDAATLRWKRLLASGKDIALAVGVAERLNLRTLLGFAYHAMMLQGRDVWDNDAEPPAISHSPRCTGGAQARCNQAWAALWRSTLDMGRQVLLLQYADVVGKLMLAESVTKALVEREIPTQGMLDGMPWCKDNVLAAVAGKVKEVQESLADYFTDVV